METPKCNDTALMQRIGEGDQDAFDSLFHCYYQRLVSISCHMISDQNTARDIVQEVFARFWAGRSKYTSLRSPKDFLFISTRNLSISHLRSKNRSFTRHDRLHYEERFSAGFIEDEVYRCLDEAIDQLAPRSRQVIKCSIEGMSQEDIARQMSISVVTVKSLKSAAIKKLRQIMNGKGLNLFVSLLG